MGLSSSQARMLLLTARKSDLEYRAQMISQRKINLAMQTEQLATEYSQSTANRVMKLNYANVDGVAQYEKLTYAGLTSTNPEYVGQYLVKTSSGKYAATDTLDALKVAAKLEGVSNPSVTQKKVLKQFMTNDDGTETSVNLSYSNFTSNNSSSGDYIIKTKDNKVAVANDTDALRIAAKLENLKGNTVDTTSLSDVEKKDLLAKYQDQFSYMKDIQDSSYFSNALINGEITVAAADTEAKDYKQVDLSTIKNIKIQEENSYSYEPVDLSSMTSSEKTALLAKYKNKITVVAEMNNSDYFQDALRNGGLFLLKLETNSGTSSDGNINGGDYKSVSWSSTGVIADVLDTSDDAQAEAEYESKTVVLSNQDKMLDLELNQIETQHKAIETEYDSVKKVIEKNIDVSYKIFA